MFSTVSCGGRIHRQHLCRGVMPPPPNKCPSYDIKQSNGNARVMLELWGMWSTLSLPLLIGPLWPGIVTSERVRSMGQIELFDIQTVRKQITYAKLNCQKYNYVRVFANGPGDLGSIPGRVLPKTQKMVLDASLLNTQHYKVRIKSRVEQSRERISALPYTLV